jgi:hypothetical protein
MMTYESMSWGAPNLFSKTQCRGRFENFNNLVASRPEPFPFILDDTSLVIIVGVVTLCGIWL